MSVTETTLADGSAVADQRATVRIDRSNQRERWRFVCPNGHTNWAPTNNHLWCKGCRRQVEAGHDDVDPEHWELVDKQTDEEIPWSAVELVEPDDPRRWW